MYMNIKLFLLNIFKTRSHVTTTSLDIKKINDIFEDLNEFKKDYALTVKKLVELQRSFEEFLKDTYMRDTSKIDENFRKVKDFGYKLDMARGQIEDLKTKSKKNLK